MRFWTQQKLLFIGLVLAFPVHAGADADCPAGPFECVTLNPPKTSPKSGTDPTPTPKPSPAPKPSIPPPSAPPGAVWFPVGPGSIETDKSRTSESISSLIQKYDLPRLSEDEVPAVRNLLGSQVKKLDPDKYYYAPNNNRGVIFQGKQLQK